MHSFVSLCYYYYRSFIQNFSNIIEPLQRIIACKNFKWGTEQEVFCKKEKSSDECSNVLLLPSKLGVFVQATDASYSAIGAVLSQEQNDK